MKQLLTYSQLQAACSNLPSENNDRPTAWNILSAVHLFGHGSDYVMELHMFPDEFNISNTNQPLGRQFLCIEM